MAEGRRQAGNVLGPVRPRPTPAEAAWSLTEAANEPFFTLVQRYVFPPFFVGTLAASAGPAGGAALWGYATAVAGLIVALVAPMMGALADGLGRRRPFLIGLAGLAFLASAALWFAEPGRPLFAVALVAALALAAYELLAVATNSFLPVVVRRGWFGALSGLAFAFGQLAGIAALLLVIALAEQPPAFIAGVPNGVDRLAGPMAAIAMLVFLAPGLLLFRDPPAVAPERPLRRAAAELAGTIRHAWRDRALRYFYLGRMIGGDGLALIFAFGAVLAGQSFGWTAATLASFGIGITLASAAGGLVSAAIDRHLGPRRTVILGFALVLLGLIGILGAGPESLFGRPTAPVGAAPFATPQEWMFVGSAVLVALGAGPAIAGMRALMASIAPPDRVSASFGLYAFVGKATNFVGPLLLGLVVSASGSLRLGLGVALLFLLAGIACFLRMPAEKRRAFPA